MATIDFNDSGDAGFDGSYDGGFGGGFDGGVFDGGGLGGGDDFDIFFIPVLLGTVTNDEGLVVELWATDSGNGFVELELRVVSGEGDLRGFYLDLADPTVTSISGDDVTATDLDLSDKESDLSKSINMNGTKVDFDMGAEIGTNGISQDDISTTTMTLEGVSLDDLEGALFGVRLTSTGEDREGSEKLVGEIQTESPPTVGGSFPTFDKDISNIVLYFDQDGDGLVSIEEGITLKVDEWNDLALDGSDDLDDILPDVMAYIEANFADLDASMLLGVAIKGGSEASGGYHTYFDLDGDETDVDVPPTPDGELIVNNDITYEILWSDIFTV